MSDLADPDLFRRFAADATPERPAVESMARWTDAMFELFARSAEVTTDPAVRSRLMGARDDALALGRRLHWMVGRETSVEAMATLHSIWLLWEANQPRFEELAADVDPDWYGAWRTRWVMERIGRHGPRPRATDELLPYSA